jgi:hypothetical protein
MGMSGEEFLRRWDDGEFRDQFDKRGHENLTHLAMMMALGRADGLARPSMLSQPGFATQLAASPSSQLSRQQAVIPRSVFKRSLCLAPSRFACALYLADDWFCFR